MDSGHELEQYERIIQQLNLIVSKLAGEVESPPTREAALNWVFNELQQLKSEGFFGGAETQAELHARYKIWVEQRATDQR